MTCECASEMVITLGRVDEYARAKTVLDRAVHPTFIGSKSVRGWARDGGLIFATHEGADIAVAMVNPRHDSLQVISVVRAHQRHGIGAVMLRYLLCSWVRSTEDAVPFFERVGYVPIGEPMPGRVRAVQLLVREHLLDVPHRIAGRDGACECHADVLI